jgi:glucoamylase
VLDPRGQATLAALEALFDGQYAINRVRPPGHGLALGRYASDVYYSGGAYYFATLAGAEFYFRLAHALHLGAKLPVAPDNARFRERLGETGETTDALHALRAGDAIMRTVQVYTPASGALSEQFDRTTGAQTSAKDLAWSYAAFITAAASRRRACAAMRG